MLGGVQWRGPVGASVLQNSVRVARGGRRWCLTKLHQALAKIIRRSVQVDLGRPILLAKFVAVSAAQQRDMSVLWRSEPQNEVEIALTMSRVEQVLPAHDVSEVRLGIIDRGCQLISEQAITALDDEILGECFDGNGLRSEEAVFKVSEQ